MNMYMLRTKYGLLVTYAVRNNSVSSKEQKERDLCSVFETRSILNYLFSFY